jgi:hypothetical protein
MSLRKASVTSIVLVIVMTSAAVAAAAPASAAPDCGVVVSYGEWNDSPGTSVRTNNWSYYNCSSISVRRKVVLNNFPDSPCFTIGSRGGKDYSWNETDSVVGHYGAYQSTISC